MFVGEKSHMHESRGCRGTGLPKNFKLICKLALAKPYPNSRNPTVNKQINEEISNICISIWFVKVKLLIFQTLEKYHLKQFFLKMDENSL